MNNYKRNVFKYYTQKLVLRYVWVLCLRNEGSRGKNTKLVGDQL